MSTEINKWYRFRRIRAIELLNILPTSDKRFYRLKLFVGDTTLKKTDTFKLEKKVLERDPTRIPKWTVDLDLSNFNESESFQVDVYHRRDKGDYRCFGFCRASIRDVLIGRTDIIVMSISSNSPCPNVSLKIFREGASDYSSITHPASEDQDMSAAPQSGPWNTVDPESQDISDLSGLQSEEISARSVEDDWATAGKVIENTAKPNEPLEWISKLIDGIDTVENVIDAFKDLHPAASIAWGIISSCVNILKQQTEQDKTVLRLYEAMITTYKEASDDRLLWHRKQLKPIYESLFQTTNECGMLIKRYTKKNRFECLFSPNVTQKAEEFIQGFANLREQLDSGVAKDALVVTLGVRANVDILAMRTLLQELKGERELGPKSTCMPGTRVETINYLLTWIGEYDDGILWCSGLAGTGKSALVGTLHKLLSFQMSGRSHLAAFIRYDRTMYRHLSELITSIAYSLGMFDQRIGNAIAKALAACRAAANMPASEARSQFRLLLQEPLETIPELQDEGPLVVIIDGLDESDVSKELLEVLADGFGPKLPFMRLIVSSQPEERISRVFKHHQKVHCFPLDTSSDEVKHDIRHFIQQRFASIEDKGVWGRYNEQDVVTLLAERASGLFIWAATVCSFLCDFPGSKRLEVLLETTIPADAMAALMTLYQTALETIVSEVSGTKEDIRRCIRAVLGTLIVRKHKMTVSMLAELVLHEGDPSAQLIVAKLGSVVQEKSGSLELIHKSFDDFLRDHSRCGDGWFIDVKEQEKELARGCVSFLTMLSEKWMPRTEEDQDRFFEIIFMDSTEWEGIQESARTQDYVVLSEGTEYAVNVLDWHHDAFIELGVDTYRALFEHHFLLWYTFCMAVGTHSDGHPFGNRALLKIIFQVNAEVTDQNLRTCFYHAFLIFGRVIECDGCSSVNAGIPLSPSNNVICRDWKDCGIKAPLDKERLLALIPWKVGVDHDLTRTLSVFQGSRYIRYECTEPDEDAFLHRLRFGDGVLHSSGSSVLFNIDTGRIAETPSEPILCFPDLPSYGNISYEQMDASVQIIRLVQLPDDFEFSHLTGIQYEVIERRDTLDDDWGHSTDSGDNMTMFISIVNTQTSHCDNYLFPGWSKHSCDIVQYAQGFFIVDKDLGSMLKVEPGTAGSNKWMTLDDRENIHGFTVMEDGSRLLGWTADTSLILLREWETSTGTLCSDHIHGFPGFKGDAKLWDTDSRRYKSALCYIRCQMSPDGSKVAITDKARSQTCILGVTSGSSKDNIAEPIEVVENVYDLAWFPDSKTFAYLRDWRRAERADWWLWDVVVRDPASRQSTTIHCSNGPVNHRRIFVTDDGCRLITQDDESFMTWDVSDL